MSIWTIFAVWLRYFLVFVPGMPGVGMNLFPYIDCIFVQAFGRGTWNDKEMFGKLMKIRRAAGMSVYQTFMILRDEVHFQPGLSNIAIANFVMALSRLFPKAALMVQWEVAYAMFELDPDWYLEKMSLIDCLFPAREDYFATYHVKLMSKACMRARGCVLPLEVAHPAMISRALMTVWKTGVFAVVIPTDFGGYDLNTLWVWDPNSQQPWTRSFGAWWKRDLIGRMAHVVTHFMPFVYLLLGGKLKMLPGNWIRFTPPPVPRVR
jgi:hypothetical protein